MLVLINLLWVSAVLIPEERSPALLWEGSFMLPTSITRFLVPTAISLIMTFPAQTFFFVSMNNEHFKINIPDVPNR